MTKTLKEVKEMGRFIAGPDCCFYADFSQDIAVIHVGFLKDGKTVTRTLPIALLIMNPDLEDILKDLRKSLEEPKEN